MLNKKIKTDLLTKSSLIRNENALDIFYEYLIGCQGNFSLFAYFTIRGKFLTRLLEGGHVYEAKKIL